MKDIFQFRTKAEQGLALILCALIVFNYASLIRDASILSAKRKRQPFYFSGTTFEAIRPLLKNVKYAGYCTDKDMDDKKNAALFSQAQYVLAPTILDLNNPAREFLIFDFSDEKKAISKIRELKATPLKRSPQGIIVAKK